MDYFNRGQAPFSDALWSEIDQGAIKTAREQLTARRFLDVEGPFGVGLTAIEVGNDDYCRQPGPDEAGAVIGRTIAVPMLRRSFRLSIRRIAAYIENGQPLDLSPAQDAAEAVALREEELIYQGQQDFGVPGLLTVDGRQQIEGATWLPLDQALQDALAAATKLDDAGFRGPYTLVLAPALYNALFRLYPGTDVLQLEHLRRLCTGGIYKARIEGGVMVDPRAGVLVVGQDLRSGYVGQDGIHHQLYVSESIVLRIDDPKAICTISAHLDRRTSEMTEQLFRDDGYRRSCTARVAAAEPDGIRLDRTVFYPAGGGQPGDTGTLRLASGAAIVIVDTIKGASPDEVIHVAAPGSELPEPETEVTAEIDWDRRHRLMRMHTCLHLLCSIVPGAVTGGQVSDGRGRLDFDIPGSGLDKEAITSRLNALIAEAHPVEPRWIADEELAARPELVRTMSVKPPTGMGRVRLIGIAGVDLQPCGGTHVRNTAEIGPVAVTKIENKGKQNRRVIVAFAE